jgi:hypothetical protein
MGVDPTGEFLLMTFVGFSARVAIGVAVVGSIALSATYLPYLGNGHPNDKTTAQYQARLEQLNRLITTMEAVGTAYSVGGLSAVERRFPHWQVPRGFSARPLATRAFPARWKDLASHMRYSTSKYTFIGHGPRSVAVGFAFGEAGINSPIHPGLTISHEYFWKAGTTLDHFLSAGVLLHEAYHDTQYFGHGAPLSELVPVMENPNKPNAYDGFIDFLQAHVDGNGKSLLSYVIDEAKIDGDAR